jgi:hypothetical protein
VIQYSPQMQSPPTQNPPPSYQPVEQTIMQPIAPTRSGTRQPPKKTGKRSKRRANNATDVNRSQDSKRDSISSMASQLFGKHHHLSAAHHNNHPQKMPLFGAPLVESIAINGVQSELPTVVFRCLEYLNANQAQMEEGIYRISGGSTQVQFLKSLFDKGTKKHLLPINY